MIQAIRLRVRNHDAYQLEFKIDYSLLPKKKTRYTIDVYFFIPHSLDINSRTYTESDFYRDAKHNVRLRTPRLSLKTLTTGPNSPLLNCERIAGTPDWQHDERLCRQLSRSLQVMRPVLNAGLRAHVRQLAAHVASSEADEPNRTVQVQKLVEEMLARTQEIAKRYRGLSSRILAVDADSRVANVYRLTDEAISLVIEDALVRAYRVLKNYSNKSVAACLQEQIAEQNQRELVYRQAHNFESVTAQESTAEGNENGSYLRRVSLLKKFTSSALFLTTSIRREGTTTEQFLYAIAAGMSMIFATVVAFYFQARFDMLTFPLFISLVVAYMFKDRIKESGRAVIAGYARRYFYDQRTVLRTLDGRHKLGYVREKVTFVDPKEVPAAVLAQRHHQLPEGVRSTELEEEVLHYSKQVLIDKGAFRHVNVGGLELTGIRDIMRYHIWPYLRQMAGPLSLRHHLDDGELRSVWYHKTYQLYIVVECGWNDGRAHAHRQATIVHLDRNGILRTEPGSK